MKRTIAPERLGVAVRRPCDHRPVTVTLDVESAAQAAVLLAWGAQQLRGLPDVAIRDLASIVGARAEARLADTTAGRILAAMADVIDPDGAKQLGFDGVTS